MTKRDGTIAVVVALATIGLLINVVGAQTFFAGVGLVVAAVGVVSVVAWLIDTRSGSGDDSGE